jgi:hypothetical protein
MAIEFRLGRFGDRRLEKGGLLCTPPWLNGRVRVSGELPADVRKRCDLRVSCAIIM